jgi:hypothetical protein
MYEKQSGNAVPSTDNTCEREKVRNELKHDVGDVLLTEASCPGALAHFL